MRESDPLLRQQAKRDKNRDAARRARLRKNIYIDLLEESIEKMEKCIVEGKELEKSMLDYLGKIEWIRDAEKNPNIDHYFCEEISESGK